MADRREPQVALGVAVRVMRERKRIQQQSLAAKAGLSQRWLADVEKGKSNPTYGNVRRLADALKVPLPELMQLVETIEVDNANTGPAIRRESAKGA